MQSSGEEGRKERESICRLIILWQKDLNCEGRHLPMRKGNEERNTMEKQGEQKPKNLFTLLSLCFASRFRFWVSHILLFLWGLLYAVIHPSVRNISLLILTSFFFYFLPSTREWRRKHEEDELRQKIRQRLSISAPRLSHRFALLYSSWNQTSCFSLVTTECYSFWFWLNMSSRVYVRQVQGDMADEKKIDTINKRCIFPQHSMLTMKLGYKKR